MSRRPRALKSPLELFERHVDKTGPAGCWLWRASSNKAGYGRIYVLRDGRKTIGYAHRVAHELFIGPIPPGFQVDHLCHVRPCVNPEHLEAVTQQENLRRSHEIGNRRLATCKRGHDWGEIPPLVAHRSGGSVTRRCRACAYELRRRHKAMKARAV